MRRLPQVAFLLVALTSVPAFAGDGGFYVGAGIGGSAKVEGPLSSYLTTREEGSGGRLFAGKRFGPWGVEASIFGSDLQGTDLADYASLSLGADVRYHLPITGSLELYVRGGLNTSVVQRVLPDGQAAEAAFAGNGYDYGAGAQYGFGLVPGTELAIFVDLGEQVVSMRAESGGAEVEGTLQTALIGVSLRTGIF